ncbi:phage tail repeat-like family [Trichomonas vaginalis G3]|uniref:phage tail repeat-like family n=1 Tax=Trichomonas vaginalis (strain ATCC PRA-98 / G3) TaxID=412133 RepID=UPI0021E5F52D|nr:phage tail repeat-like family [Trichomonas vaginalis G3]KAI5539167.1 phage tail repeat-like family [Trichomonas vaginalis G3]
MSKETASMREIQHNRQLIIQALNKNTTNFSNYSKISESLKEGNLKLTLNPLTDEFLFQDSKNHTVCVNPTKGTLNEKPIKELLLKADIDNKADKEYVDDELARVASALVKKADKEYVNEKDEKIIERVEWYHERTTKILKGKADTGWVSGCLDLKADKNHTHTIANITNLQETLNRKSDVGHTHTIANITNLQETLNRKSDVGHTHSFFATVGIENIEGTVEETGGDVLDWKPPNFPQGLTSEDDITTMKDIRCRDVYVMEDENKVKFTAQDLYDKKADKTELQTLKTEILQTIYPVGSIYTSMNSTRPEVVLGFGTWTQIFESFLYCAHTPKKTGGSKTISVDNLPPHSHSGTTNFSGDHSHSLRDHPLYNSEYEAGYDVLSPDYNHSAKKTFRQTEPGGNHQHTFTTTSTGLGKKYMPPYMTVCAWYRIA